MAKLGLLFVVVFIMVQLALAARITRDTPETSSSQTSIDQTLDSIKKGFQDTFTKENLDGFLKSLSEFGEKVKDAGENFVGKISEKAGELAKKD
uniref:Putative salivary secreted peptide n=1 Tax=Corethrella appendiculata TaxID=1370023 RepID=U5ERV2_9DIPT